MDVHDTCRLAAELAEEFGVDATEIAGRAAAVFAADGFEDRALVWRALQAILTDIDANRLDPYARITVH